MNIRCSINERPSVSNHWETRWQGLDNGLLCSWLRGIEKAATETELREAAVKGELPLLAWKGGGPSIKAGKRLGSLHYLATWQGLRGEDLSIDTVAGAVLTCARTRMVVTFTDDLQALAKAAPDSGGDE